MLRLFVAVVLLCVLSSGCTTADRYGKDGEVVSVKRFMGIPYMEERKTTTRGEF